MRRMFADYAGGVSYGGSDKAVIPGRQAGANKSETLLGDFRSRGGPYFRGRKEGESVENDEIKLLRGNCLELAEQIPDGSIDMVLCDPPYGVTDCRWDSVLPFDAMWRMYERVVKANGAIALFSSQPFTTRLIHSNICQYRYTWYWVKNIKTGHVFAKVQPMRQVEEVCIFYRKKPLYQPQGLVKLEREIIHRKQAQADAVYRLDKRANASVQRYGNYPSNVLRFDVDSGKNRVHPSQKPVALLEYLIRTYTRPGETVLDNSVGSGSTGVACVHTGRRFVGMEQDEQYFAVSERRIAEAGGPTTGAETERNMEALRKRAGNCQGT